MPTRTLIPALLLSAVATFSVVAVNAQQAQPAQLPPPPDVAAPPPDALVTPSGLASKVLTPGTGTERPTAASTIKVHYSGWTTDGQMFDSSVVRGEPMARQILDGASPPRDTCSASRQRADQLDRPCIHVCVLRVRTPEQMRAPAQAVDSARTGEHFPVQRDAGNVSVPEGHTR